MRAIWPLILILAACQPASVATVTSRPTYRDPTVLIASKANFDAASFAGEWHEVARFPGTRGCPAARIRYDVTVSGGLQRTTRCPDGTGAVIPIALAPLGRLSVADGTGSRPIWVLWTDTTYRTAILVSPDGTGGQILDRTRTLPVDRLRAAVEVLDFNGFDAGALTFP